MVGRGPPVVVGRGTTPVVAGGAAVVGRGDGAGPVPQPTNACLTAFIRGYLSKKYMKSFIGIVRFKLSKGDNNFAPP